MMCVFQILALLKPRLICKIKIKPTEIECGGLLCLFFPMSTTTVKTLKFWTPQTIAIIVLKIEKFDVTLHKCIQKNADGM